MRRTWAVVMHRKMCVNRCVLCSIGQFVVSRGRLWSVVLKSYRSNDAMVEKNTFYVELTLRIKTLP